jgi:predicted dehydrogenase
MYQKPGSSRRAFLRESLRGSVVAATGLAGPSIFFCRSRAVCGENPSDFVRVGFIGVGNQGGNNLGKMMKNAVAVCDVDSGRLSAARKRVEEANQRPCLAFKDYRQMLESKEVDAVLITTPDHWHALPAVHACEAGKDVYCEKPLTLTIGEGKVMVKAARKYKRVVQTGSQQRSDAKFLKACEYVRNGRLGKVKRVLVGLPGVNWVKEPPAPDSEPPTELDYDFWLGPAPSRAYNRQRVHYYFRFFWDYSGGQMTNWGAHHLDIVQWALGKDDSGPVAVEASAEFDPDKRFEVPQKFSITYQYENGPTVEVRSPDARVTTLLPSKADQARSILEGKDQFAGCIFEGEKGLLYVNRNAVRAWPEAIFQEPIGGSDTRLYASRDHHQNWLDCIQSRKTPICDVAIGHRSATVCHLGNIAIRTGRKLRWDPLREEFIGDAQAAAWLNKPYRAPWALPVIS